MYHSWFGKVRYGLELDQFLVHYYSERVELQVKNEALIAPFELCLIFWRKWLGFWEMGGHYGLTDLLESPLFFKDISGIFIIS